MAITPLFVAHAEWVGGREWIDSEPDASQKTTTSTTRAKTGQRSFWVNQTYFYRPIPATKQVRIGAWVFPGPAAVNFSAQYLSATTSANGEIVSIRDMSSSIDQFGIFVNGTVQQQIGANYQQWQHWGLDIKSDATDGWFYFYINGELAMSFEGNTTGVDITRIRMGPSGVNSAFRNTDPRTFIDDIYVDDSTGEATPQPLQDRRFQLVLPTADGLSSEWTPSTGTDHFDLVDDVSIGTATYISAGAENLTDTFAVGSPPAVAGLTPTRVWVQAYAQRTNAAVNSGYIPVAGVSEGGVITPDADWTFNMTPFETTNLSQEFGVKSTGDFA